VGEYECGCGCECNCEASANEVPEAKSAQLTWHVGDETIDYVATAGHLDIIDREKVLEGRMFNVSYVAKAIDGSEVDPHARPVTFCYNGGPGSASVPINFGGLGPRRVVTHGMDFVGAGYEVVDNPGTLLRESDLVFPDALGTGWSFVAEGYDTKRVYGLEEDARTFCRAICQWLDENDRWGSPLYIFGESYGTMRSAVLMRYLGEAHVPLAGVVMLSAYYDWTQNLPGNDLYYVGMVPTFASTAQYFGLVGQGVDEDEWFDKASAFAGGEYAFRGDEIDPAEKDALAEHLSAFIGLPKDYLLARNNRVELEDFRKDLLASRGLVCGRLDQRFTETSLLSSQRASFYFACEDPANHALESCWYAAFRDFLRSDLGYEGPAEYRLSVWGEIGIGWNWVHDEPGFDETTVAAPNLAYDIAVALRRSPTTKLCILGGRYDTATPWWNVRHTMSQLYLPDALKRQITWHRYGCGHMAYTDEPTLHAMAADLREFYSE
jgi:carboxypeptidase C (cathepsin A)